MLINNVTLYGRLSKDPELRTTPNDKRVCSFTLAIDNSTRKDDGTSFIDCTAWGKLAETIAQYVKKGQGLAVQGKLRQESWDTDNGKRYRTYVLVDDFSFGEKAKSGSSSDTISPEELPF